MNTALFTLFIHYCLNQKCETQPLSQWDTLEECQAQIPIYYVMVPGDYLMECK